MKLSRVSGFCAIQPSHPVRVRGLKRITCGRISMHYEVAPRAGAWVETSFAGICGSRRACRTPCGCVG